MLKLLAWLMYKLPRISSGSTSGSLGATGAATELKTAPVGTTVSDVARSAGARAFFGAVAGNCGFTAVLAMIAAVFSRLATAGSGVFSLTSVVAGAAPVSASLVGAGAGGTS